MKILIATDSFKDGLPALEVCQAIGRGVLQVSDVIDVQLFPLGDGGEGTAEILTWHNGGTWLPVEVHDPLFRKIIAHYGRSKDRQTAYIEMAQASGLQLLKKSERDVLKTSTFGTGELIRHAINCGAKRIVLGIGGSATNDVGVGMAEALGYQFKAQQTLLSRLTGHSLADITEIINSDFESLRNAEVQVLCDVDNPLFGPTGAANTYGRQKGADEDTIKSLDQGTQRFASILERHFEKSIAHIPGAGAAGGLGAGALAFLDAQLLSGIDFVLDETGFDVALRDADLVITGEGKIDDQTLHGKLITGITQRANQLKIPVIALCGSLLVDSGQIKLLGLQSAHSINPEGIDLETALSSTAIHLEQTAIRVFKAMIH